MSTKTKKAAATVKPSGLPVGDAAADAQAAAVASPEAPAEAGLLGSSVQPSVFTIGGTQVQLGDIVRAAHVATSLSVAEWNELAADVREGLIADELAAMQADAEAAAAAGAEAAAEAPVFPRSITLRNNSGFAVAEPATGAFIGGGASVHVVLRDKAQAVRMLQNVESIRRRTGGRQSLVVVGLDDVKLPETEEAP